jgi:diguanylate cyclase (GGDEF)-like protein
MPARLPIAAGRELAPHRGHIRDHDSVSRILATLFGLVDSKTSPHRTRERDDSTQKGNSNHQGKEISMANETTHGMPLNEHTATDEIPGNSGAAMDTSPMDPVAGEPHAGTEPEINKLAIHELQAIAEQFNAAFKVALYELDSSRKQLHERSVRIDELNESIRTINDCLTDTTNKAHRRDEEHAAQIKQLNERIEASEAERERLQQLVHEQIASLDARAEEVTQLSASIQELTDTLEQRTAEAQRTQDELLTVRDNLTTERERLQQQVNEQGQTLEERDRVLADLNSQVDGLTAELDSKRNELASLNENVNELKDKIEVQTESMRMQSESHEKVCDELNAQIASITGVLEALQDAHNELGTHAEKLENLNAALHESSVSENVLHKKLLAGKTSEIDSLKTKLAAAYESLKGQSGDPATVDNFQTTLHDLESRLIEAETQNQALADKARKAEELEGEIIDLRAAVHSAGNTTGQSAEERQHMRSLEKQITDYQSAMDASRAEMEVLSERLRERDNLEQEVLSLREELQQANDKLLRQPGSDSTVDALRNEVEQLTAALAASEQNCARLQAASSSDSSSASTSHSYQSRPTQVSYPANNLIDRVQFVTQLNSVLAEPDNDDASHTVMYVLVDNFIRIRDEIGVMHCEHVINEIYRIIESHCDSDDLISRFGDCVFAILCRNADVDEAQQKATNIRSSVENHIFESSGRSLVATTSIGICSIRENDTSAEDIVSRADLACEVARSSGGNQVTVNSTIADEMLLTGNADNYAEIICKTLAEKRIKVHYQPISSIKDFSGEHYEVLIRIVDENGSIILPGEFFAMAEKSGHAVDIDRYVIESIMKEMSDRADKKVTLFIKLTRQSITDHDLPEWIMGKIRHYDINPGQLVFEISENVLQNDIKNLSTLSKALHAIGCKVAIEHYRLASPAQHLLHIHMDYLKIDSGLIDGLSRKGQSLPKVTAIMKLARENKYTTIAEGVENPATLAILWELGVSYVQGYFIQVPTENLSYDFGGHIDDSEETPSTKATFTIS